MKALVLAALLATGASAGEISVEVTGAAGGQLLASLFQGEEHWMTTPIAEAKVPVAPGGPTRIGFGEHPEGAYGVAIIHDADGDGELDLNLLGIPTEAFGFSNNAAARFGPPGWEAARVLIGPEGARLTIAMDRAE